MSDPIERPQITDKGRAVLAIDAVMGRRLEDAVAMYDALADGGWLATDDHDRAVTVKALRDANEQLGFVIHDRLGYKVPAVASEELLAEADRIEREGGSDV